MRNNARSKKALHMQDIPAEDLPSVPNKRVRRTAQELAAEYEAKARALRSKELYRLKHRMGAMSDECRKLADAFVAEGDSATASNCLAAAMKLDAGLGRYGQAEAESLRPIATALFQAERGGEATQVRACAIDESELT